MNILSELDVLEEDKHEINEEVEPEVLKADEEPQKPTDEIFNLTLTETPDVNKLDEVEPDLVGNAYEDILDVDRKTIYKGSPLMAQIDLSMIPLVCIDFQNIDVYQHFKDEEIDNYHCIFRMYDKNETM